LGWVFASTDKALADALGMAGLEKEVKYQVDLKEGALYQLIGDRIVKTRTKIMFGASKSTAKWQDGFDYSSRYNDYTGYKTPNTPKVISGNTNKGPIVFGSPEWIAEYGVPGKMRQLPLPTAETTTFTELEGVGMQQLRDVINDQQPNSDEMWADYIRDTDGTPKECEWCTAELVGRYFRYNKDVICAVCFLSARSVDEEDADDEATQAYFEQQEDDAAFAQHMLRESRTDIDDNFELLTASSLSVHSEVDCCDCEDTLIDLEIVWVHRTHSDYRLCGDCHHRIYPHAPFIEQHSPILALTTMVQ
jgi:hypothetical protein